MEKIFIIASSILAGTMGAYAQGSLVWQDAQDGKFMIEILSPNPADPSVEQTGQTTFDQPSGMTSYGGGYIGGVAVGGIAGNGPNIGPTPADGPGGIDYQNAANFTAGLYVDTTLSALTGDILNGTPAATTTLLGGANAGVYYTGAPTYVSGLPPGTSLFIGIAAWYSGNGAASYALSVADNGAEGYVESTSSVALGGGAFPPAALPGLGLTSFSLMTPTVTSTPEPNTVALGLFGASALLARMRRKK